MTPRSKQELLVDASERKFFSFVELDSDIDADEVRLERSRTQVQHLHRVILTQEVVVDGPEVSAGLELWREVYMLTGDAVEAWTVLTTALLRDPNYLLY